MILVASIDIHALWGAASPGQYGARVDTSLQWTAVGQCGIYIYLGFQPANVNISTASHLTATNRWAEHERRTFISRPPLEERLRGGACGVWWDWRRPEDGQHFKHPKELKGREAQDSRSKRDFTALPDGVFGLSFHHTEASPTVLSLWVSVWCWRPERSRPLGHSRLGEAMVDGQLLLLMFTILCLPFPDTESSQGWCKAILLFWCLGTLRSCGDVLLEFQVIPGYSKAIGWVFRDSQVTEEANRFLEKPNTWKERKDKDHKTLV